MRQRPGLGDDVARPTAGHDVAERQRILVLALYRGLGMGVGGRGALDMGMDNRRMCRRGPVEVMER